MPISPPLLISSVSACARLSANQCAGAADLDKSQLELNSFGLIRRFVVGGGQTTSQANDRQMATSSALDGTQLEPVRDGPAEATGRRHGTDAVTGPVIFQMHITLLSAPLWICPLACLLVICCCSRRFTTSYSRFALRQFARHQRATGEGQSEGATPSRTEGLRERTSARAKT